MPKTPKGKSITRLSFEKPFDYRKTVIELAVFCKNSDQLEIIVLISTDLQKTTKDFN